MAKSTHSITYAYDIDGAVVLIERVHVGTAYARNGNVHNPTEYFRWNWRIACQPGGIEDGPRGNGSSRSDAYERARAKVLGIRYAFDEERHRYENVRPWTVVKAEMQANYRWREVAA